MANLRKIPQSEYRAAKAHANTVVSAEQFGPEWKITLNTPPAARFHMTDWQREDIIALLAADSSKGSTANWSEMGCYKTSTCLWFARELEAARILIITTRTAKSAFFDAWPELMYDYPLENVTAQEFKDPTKYFAKHSHGAFIAHYHCFQNRAKPREALTAYKPWDLIILDEGHRIKSRDAQWPKNILKLKAHHKHLMTGTGFQNRPDEIWQLLHWLNPDAFSSYWSFRRRFCLETEIKLDDGRTFKKVIGIKPDMIDTFQKVVQAKGPRRLKREVFDALKDPPIVTPVHVDLSPTQQRMYDDLKRQLKTLDEQGELIDSPSVLSLMTRMRQVCCGTPLVLSNEYDPDKERRVLKIKLTDPSAKLDAVQDLLENTDYDQPFVIFSNFSGTLDLLEQRLNGARTKVPYIRLLPSDPDRNRTLKIARFQSTEPSSPLNPLPKAFLCTITLGSESITLTRASRVIFIDQHFSPAVNDQAIARCWRPGQTERVQVLPIMARGSIDHVTAQMLKTKQGWFEQIFKV